MGILRAAILSEESSECKKKNKKKNPIIMEEKMHKRREWMANGYTDCNLHLPSCPESPADPMLPAPPGL